MSIRANSSSDLSSDLSSLPHHILTPTTMTLFLAYIHYYTPRRLSGRHLAAGHMRRLSRRLGMPQPRLLSIRRHPLLAAHLTLAKAAQLLSANGDYFQLPPKTTRWLVSPHEEQIEALLAPLLEEARWIQVVNELNLANAITVDYRCYLRQILSRQKDLERPPAEPARWMKTKADLWQLCLPTALPPWLLFDLLQLGAWDPDARLGARGMGRLTCTPLTIAGAPRRGYGEAAIRWLLETATQQPLPSERAEQLTAWLRRGEAYRVETLPLLTTAQDEQLTAILENRRLKPYILQQITPRQAVIQTELIPRLEKWLARRGYPIQAPQADKAPGPASEDDGYLWLGLRLLAGLGELMPLPYPPPHGVMERWATRLEPGRQSELERAAQQILDDLRDLIRGRDAFFPARQSPTPHCRRRLQAAIEAQASLTIHYRSLGDYEPRARRVRPYRLAQRQNLFYLHAYCYRAEADLTFRLDRIHAIHD